MLPGSLTFQSAWIWDLREDGLLRFFVDLFLQWRLADGIECQYIPAITSGLQGNAPSAASSFSLTQHKVFMSDLWSCPWKRKMRSAVDARRWNEISEFMTEANHPLPYWRGRQTVQGQRSHLWLPWAASWGRRGGVISSPFPFHQGQRSTLSSTWWQFCRFLTWMVATQPWIVNVLDKLLKFRIQIRSWRRFTQTQQGLPSEKVRVISRTITKETLNRPKRPSALPECLML